MIPAFAMYLYIELSCMLVNERQTITYVLFFLLVTGIDDPHFFVPVHGSENPVCFDLYGENGQIFQLLEDKETGKKF